MLRFQIQSLAFPHRIAFLPNKSLFSRFSIVALSTAIRFPATMDTPSDIPASKNNEISGMRQDYTQSTLLESTIEANPISQFEAWFADSKKLVDSMPDFEANAMHLATASKTGVPSSRIVLLKGFDDRGFVFFSNYQSRKGREMEANPMAALTFYWGQRQVRIEGSVKRISNDESVEYFNSRPRKSQLGAWASRQSTILPNGREELDQNYVDVEERFKNVEKIPKPDFWGGYRVEPTVLEFWQGRSSRLHDRLVYSRLSPSEQGERGWMMQRLSP